MYYYQSRTSILSVAIALPLLDILVVSLRFYARRKQRQSLLADDWLTLPALALTIGLGATLISGTALHGLGYPTPSAVQPRSLDTRTALTDTNSQITTSSQVEWAFVVMSAPALGFTKLSFLFFYRRIFCPSNKIASSLVIIFMILITSAWSLAFFFSFLFACRGNFSAWWESVVDLTSHCVDTFMLLYALAISDFIMDAIIVVLPLPMIWRLQLPIRRKLGVSFIFLLGAIAVAASITRLAIVAKEYNAGFNPNLDEDLLITGMLYWSMVEVGLGLLAANLPTLRSLLKNFPSSTIDSLRDFFSLKSFQSQQHTRLRDYNADRVHDSRQDPSISSQSRIFRAGKEESCDIEAHPMHQFDKTKSNSKPLSETES